MRKRDRLCLLQMGKARHDRLCVIFHNGKNGLKQMMEQISSLLSSYDVVLKHSLQMFQDYRYEACSDENWQQMIQQLTEELTVIEEKGSAFLTMDSKESIASGILDLLTLTQEYQESLQLIQEKKTDKVVLLAQSCLLELIEQYHIFIAQESQMEIGS